ncbi:Mg2+ transporter protein CorA-like/Zinc transport protein ZntB [Arabidopsis suecica]|uniref:Magnesium transporter MRS2-7 n=4 Tax=Arabidopsis TaxID=3701 RepID=MRS27_ARATH|nr:magnesium transporter 7 [Arabidopsis thaliana]Q304A0.1 RecName: Full=Magnesium transporter MRS2-7; AltName: Full=Magnesium Transporter 7; Short=AtMGT7 [Arabidopsis thaliana]ABD64135.2 Mg2+ transporter protein MGT7 [Arabidopsis thaliana]AED91431.1 magnesium transporter 7 [Arabidopsis thaliana]KAG7608672.1 Mg2+ transporter protein CorA-like/Zinc transport protein ZntB [Arabidopsis suecica]|eukprot:NP_196531.2 magnesium transporter 7 [Arabidopsis thaliana]
MSPDGELVPVDSSAVVTAKRKTSQLSRSWISIDATGQKTVLDVDKHVIMHRVQIHARDLRILDPNLFYPSAILGRERAIVLNLEHIKAIITAEEVLIRDSSDENVIPVLEEFQRRLPVGNEAHGVHGDGDLGEEDESPFEFRALEVALEAICSFLAARTTELEKFAYPALDELTLKISSRNLERVRKLKSAMTRLTARVQKVRDELEQLLDDDGDMADLYLTRKLVGASSSVSVSDEPIWYPTSPTIGSMISRASRVSLVTVRGDDETDVEELEMLLEAYFMQIDSTLNKLTELREYIDDTEDYINIQLDNHRNQLIQLELMLSAGTVCVSVYSMIAGIFGMNIPNTWNHDHGYIFKWVVSLTGTFCIVLFVIILSYARFRGLIGS